MYCTYRPIWGDNHYCYDSGSQTLDAVVAKYEANKGKRGYVYHPFRNPGGTSCNVRTRVIISV